MVRHGNFGDSFMGLCSLAEVCWHTSRDTGRAGGKLSMVKIVEENGLYYVYWNNRKVTGGYETIKGARNYAEKLSNKYRVPVQL